MTTQYEKEKAELREKKIIAEMAAEIARVNKYGFTACAKCDHEFDDWTTNRADGGRKERPVIKHPHLRTVDDITWERLPVYRILPCGSCPDKFKDEFWARQARDEEVASWLENGF